MLTIAGGILLALFILIIVLPLLGATIAAIFTGIRVLFEWFFRAIPYIFLYCMGSAAFFALVYNFIARADFRQGVIVFAVIAPVGYIAYLALRLRLRFGSFHAAFGYLSVRCQPVFSTDNIVRKSEAIKKYKAIEAAVHAEAKRKAHEKTEKKKLCAMDDMENLLEKVIREYRKHLSIEVIKSDEEGTISLNVNTSPLCVIKYTQAGWQLSYAKPHEPDPRSYLEKSALVGFIKRALKRELVNAVNAPQSKTDMDPPPNDGDTIESVVQKENPISDELPKTVTVAPKLVIVGIGGGGGNMVNNFVRSKEIDCRTISANTDSQALESSIADEKFLFDGSRGLGLGGKMSAGTQIGELNCEEFLRRISGYDTVILCAGLGGGTGSGVTSVLAKAAMDTGLNVLCFCTLPFHFEGERRRNVATGALDEIRSCGAWVEVFDNQELFKYAPKEWTFADAFRFADQHFLSLLHDAVISGFDRQSFDLSRCKVS